MRQLSIAFAAIALAALASQSSSSQPQETIRVINPFPPGGSTDMVARLLADQIGRTQDRPVIIENRPGAGSVIGTEVVAHSQPDGNTLLMSANSFVINRIVRKLSYDPLSFEPICLLARTAHVLAVNSGAPYRTLGEYLAEAREHPGVLTNASVGPASAQHIALEMLKRAANVDISFVPYPGNVAAVNALLGNHVTSVIVNYQDVAEHLRSGKLRALAITLGTRLDDLPGVPTVAESGFKGFETETWIGLVAPPKTPQPIVARLATLTASALQAPAVTPKLIAAGLSPVGLCGPGFSDYLRKQFEEYSHVIVASHLMIQ